MTDPTNPYTRYGFPDGVNDDVDFPTQEEYPNPTDTLLGTVQPATYPSDDAPEQVELAHPELFFIREALKPRRISARPRMTASGIPNGVNVQVAPENRKRCRISFQTDGDPIFLTNISGIAIAGPGSPVVKLTAGDPPYVMEHTGPVFAFAVTTGQNTASTLYVCEESYE